MATNATRTDLSKKKCVPCQAGTPPIKGHELQDYLSQLEGWSAVDEHHITKTYKFKDFAEALAFVNRIGKLADEEDHHPDIGLSWGKATVTLTGVTFVSGRAMLTPNAKAILDGVAASLQANPTTRVEVGGYTDNAGSRLRNITLSRARANAVANYLIQKGVSPSRLTARGYGPANPVATNATAAGRAENRRVELKRLP